MAEDTKKSRSKTLNKILLIGGIVFAIALAVAGVIAINQSKEKGTDDVLADESSLVEAIYNTDSQNKPLTDDQFYSALNKIFPRNPTSDASHRSDIHLIEKCFDGTDIPVNVSYYNNFGTSGYCIRTSKSVNAVIPLLDYSICQEYFVQVMNTENTGMLGAYLVTKDNVQVRFEYGTATGDEEATDSIADLLTSLAEQYNINQVTLTDSALLIYSYGVTTLDLLNAFDYVYQWCLGNNLDRQIFLYASDSLVAVTNPSLADNFYTENYPVQELAAIFRLNYYSANCFFGQTLQEACNVYL